MNSEAGSLAGVGGTLPGRHAFLAPGNVLHRLRCAQIAGTATSGPVQFNTGEFETGLICIRGRAFLVVQDELYEMTPFDALYVPRACDVRVDADGIGCELIEVSSAVDCDYPVQFVPCEDQQTGGVLLGSNIRAGRILAGIVFGEADAPAVVGYDPLCLDIDTDGRRGRLWFMAADGEKTKLT